MSVQYVIIMGRTVSVMSLTSGECIDRLIILYYKKKLIRNKGNGNYGIAFPIVQKIIMSDFEKQIIVSSYSLLTRCVDKFAYQ